MRQSALTGISAAWFRNSADDCSHQLLDGRMYMGSHEALHIGAARLACFGGGADRVGL